MCTFQQLLEPLEVLLNGIISVLALHVLHALGLHSLLVRVVHIGVAIFDHHTRQLHIIVVQSAKN